MTNPIRLTAPTAPLAGAASPPAAPPATPGEDLQRMASEFEAMLLRQLLSAAKMGQGQGGYADMAVESMADGISRAGGVGLAREIERALSRQIEPPAAPTSLSHSSPGGGGRSLE